MTAGPDAVRGAAPDVAPSLAVARSASPSSLVLRSPLALTTNRFLTLDNARAILASTAFVGITAIGATLVMIAGLGGVAGHLADRDRRGDVLPGHAALGLATAVLVALVGRRRAHRAAGRRHRLLARQPDRAHHRGRVRDRRGDHLVQRRDAGLPDGAGVRRAQLDAAGPAAGRVRAARRHGARPMVTLRRTTAGRQMYLVGENRAAARAAGLPVGRVTVIAWAVLRRRASR